MTHRDLVLRGQAWLRRQGCGIVIVEPFIANTHTGEQPDGIGWRDGVSILIEAKATRADFLSDKNKPFRKESSRGVGDWRFYICPPDVIKPEDLPEGWGLLWVLPKVIRSIHGVPSNCSWWSDMPFEANKRAETQIMYSALRRLSIRGHFELIYEKI